MPLYDAKNALVKTVNEMSNSCAMILTVDDLNQNFNHLPQLLFCKTLKSTDTIFIGPLNINLNIPSTEPEEKNDISILSIKLFKGKLLSCTFDLSKINNFQITICKEMFNINLSIQFRHQTDIQLTNYFDTENFVSFTNGEMTLHALIKSKNEILDFQSNVICGSTANIEEIIKRETANKNTKGLLDHLFTNAKNRQLLIKLR